MLFVSEYAVVNSPDLVWSRCRKLSSDRSRPRVNILKQKHGLFRRSIHRSWRMISAEGIAIWGERDLKWKRTKIGRDRKINGSRA